MARLSRPVTTMIWAIPEATASSTPYWMIGLSTMGSISLGCALVAGRKRVPSPAAGKTALRTFIFMRESSLLQMCKLPQGRLRWLCLLIESFDFGQSFLIAGQIMDGQTPEQVVQFG